MASTPSQFRFFECRKGWFPWRHNPLVVGQTANSVNMVLSVGRVFSWGSVRYGQIHKKSSFALAMQKALEVVGELVTSMETYHTKTVRVGHNDFARVLCALFRISNPAGKTVAWFLRVFWHEGPEAVEDALIHEMQCKDSEKQRLIASRRIARNPNERLAHLFSKVIMCVCLSNTVYIG